MIPKTLPLCLTFVLLAVLFATVMAVPPAYAQTYGVNVCFQRPAMQNLGMLSSAVVCTREAIQQALAVTLLPQIQSLLTGAVIAAVSLAVLLHGIQIMLGMLEHAGTATMMLLLKISFMLPFAIGSINLPELVNIWFTVMDQLMQTAGTTLMAGIPLLGCSAAAAPAGYEMWDAMDCIMGRLFGFGAQNVLGFGVASGLIGLLGGFLFGNTAVGWQIFMLGVTMLVSIMLAVFKAVQIFLLSLGAVAVLMALAPLVVPMVLFKYTQEFFQKWLNLLISYSMQPIIVIGMLSIFFLIINGFLADVANPNSLAGVLGINVAGWNASANSVTAGVTGAILQGNFAERFIHAGWQQPVSEAFLVAQGVPQAIIDTVKQLVDGWQSLPNAGNVGSIFEFDIVNMVSTNFNKAIELLIPFVGLIITGYLAFTMLGHVPNLAHQMTTSAVVSNLASGKSLVTDVVEDRLRWVDREAQKRLSHGR